MVKIGNYNLTLGTERFNDIGKDLVCSISNLNFSEMGIYFFIPFSIILIALIILMYKNQFKNYLETLAIKKGYIKIFMLNNSKRLKTKFIKLDKFKRFKIGKKSYSLEEMENYIFAYDKKNIPIFLYHIDFIIPFTIESEKLTKEIAKEFGIDEKEKDEVSSVKMRIDSNILQMVYDKKLLSDLYDSSMQDSFKEKMVYIALGIIGLIILYYTGYLEIILSYLG